MIRAPRGLDDAVPDPMKSLLLFVLALVLAVARPAYADELSGAPIVVVPGECTRFWQIPGGTSSPAVWDQLLSFASCIQDTSVDRVDRAEELPGFVDELQGSLQPTIQLYMVAINEAPDHIKLRAAYAIAMGQLALITRARASLANPALREQLEALLDRHAELAYMVFTTIDGAALEDPLRAQNPVDEYIFRSSHQQVLLLEKRWPKLHDESLRTLQASGAFW